MTSFMDISVFISQWPISSSLDSLELAGHYVLQTLALTEPCSC